MELPTLPSTIASTLEYELFYQLYAKISILAVKNCSFRLLSTTHRLSWRQGTTIADINNKAIKKKKVSTRFSLFGRQCPELIFPNFIGRKETVFLLFSPNPSF